ncbi:unnamed protein product [Protopolystoma xenopodis]|uniref:Uncharacterized protein n=1 Tax=Protopolystoma xenopodis TaxID=117903 RepID=A0A448XHE5_9PLAT|nr:unnamed protein product [Protopolystoma xenopodis]
MPHDFLHVSLAMMVAGKAIKLLINSFIRAPPQTKWTLSLKQTNQVCDSQTPCCCLCLRQTTIESSLHDFDLIGLKCTDSLPFRQVSDIFRPSLLCSPPALALNRPEADEGECETGCISKMESLGVSFLKSRRPELGNSTSKMPSPKQTTPGWLERSRSLAGWPVVGGALASGHQLSSTGLESLVEVEEAERKQGPRLGYQRQVGVASRLLDIILLSSQIPFS